MHELLNQLELNSREVGIRRRLFTQFVHLQMTYENTEVDTL